MTLAVSPWTGNGHDFGQQFPDDGLDLIVGGFAKDTGEDSMRHLCLNAFCRQHQKSLFRRYKKRKEEASGRFHWPH